MPRPLPESVGAGPFRVDDALRAGVTEKRLRGNDLSAPFWGVRATASATLSERAQAFATRMQDGAFFSHETAALLWGIPLPPELADNPSIHVSVAGGRRGPGGAGVIGHHLQVSERDITVHAGRRVTTLARTVCDLAPALHDEDLLTAIDNILWWRRPMSQRATPEELRATLHRFRGRRGRARLFEMAALASDRSDAPPETAFRLRFLRAGFPPAQPNERVYDTSGRFLAMPDLQFREYKMAFDYEGDHHRTDRKQWRKDLARVPRLQDAGWHHTRLSGDDLTDDREAIARARSNLTARGWTPSR